MSQRKNKKVYYHLPGLFEFYELYCAFLPLYKEHREYFYDWCEISSIYGSPADCLWGGGRAGFGSDNPEEVLKLTQEYGISARLTFSNSLLRKEHLTDKKCNILCKMFEEVGEKRNGVIVHSDLLLKYLEINYPKLYFVSSTTKVLTDFNEFLQEVKKEDFRYVVPDFRLNKAFWGRFLEGKVEGWNRPLRVIVLPRCETSAPTHYLPAAAFSPAILPYTMHMPQERPLSEMGY